VLVVLAAFVAGMALGVMFMVPRWWRSRQAARKSSMASPVATSPTASDNAGPPHGI
jgi:hypothetical protein